MSTHTPGPWRFVRKDASHALVASAFGDEYENPMIAKVWLKGADFSESNALRIVACVNACEGINPEVIPEMVRMLDRLEVALTNSPRFNPHDLGPLKTLVDLRDLIKRMVEEK